MNDFAQAIDAELQRRQPAVNTDGHVQPRQPMTQITGGFIKLPLPDTEQVVSITCMTQMCGKTFVNMEEFHDHVVNTHFHNES